MFQALREPFRGPQRILTSCLTLKGYLTNRFPNSYNHRHSVWPPTPWYCGFGHHKRIWTEIWDERTGTREGLLVYPATGNSSFSPTYISSQITFHNPNTVIWSIERNTHKIKITTNLWLPRINILIYFFKDAYTLSHTRTYLFKIKMRSYCTNCVVTGLCHHLTEWEIFLMPLSSQLSVCQFLLYNKQPQSLSTHV